VKKLSKYPKQVFWSDEDEGFIAIAPDLPGSSAFGDTEATALAELDNAIEAWIDAAVAAGNSVPAPSAPELRSAYSGKLLVRMPRTLHQELANLACREDISLNQFIVFVLAKHLSTTHVESKYSPSGTNLTTRSAHVLEALNLIVSGMVCKTVDSTSSRSIFAADISPPIRSSGGLEAVHTSWAMELGGKLERYSLAYKGMAGAWETLRTRPQRQSTGK
jgi:predicted RNase H-like HicB family nuclease